MLLAEAGRLARAELGVLFISLSPCLPCLPCLPYLPCLPCLPCLPAPLPLRPLPLFTFSVLL